MDTTDPLVIDFGCESHGNLLGDLAHGFWELGSLIRLKGFNDRSINLHSVISRFIV